MKYVGESIDGVQCVFSDKLAGGLWRSPEEYRNSKSIDEKADIYSFGIVLWSIASGKYPFSNLGKKKVVRERLAEEFIIPDRAEMLSYPQEMQDLVLECLQEDPSLRPSAKSIATRIESTLHTYKDFQ